VITLASGKSVLVDLAHTISLDHGDALVLNDGGCIEVIAAQEPLLEVSGDLVQLAWHIGNRHTPCQIETGFLLIQDDPVIGHMLDHLGAKISKVTAPFTPEGGAYGHGRTHSHDHGHTAHDH
jgi:urease accessory protein